MGRDLDIMFKPTSCQAIQRSWQIQASSKVRFVFGSDQHLQSIFFHFANQQLFVIMADYGSEELTNHLRLLNLLSPGSQIELFSAAAENSVNANWRYHLLARLKPDLHQAPYLTAQAIRRALNIAEHDFSLVPIDEEYYALRFKHEADKNRIYLKEPLIISNSILLFVEWDGMTDYRHMMVDEFKTWVQIKLSNPLMFTPDLALDFFRKVGNLPHNEENKNFYSQNGVARAKLIIKSSELLCSLAIKKFANGTVVSALFKFEKLRSICYICCMLDHTLNSCALRRLEQYRQMARRHFQEGKHLWGPFVLVVNDTNPRQASSSSPRPFEINRFDYEEDEGIPSPKLKGSKITHTLCIESAPSTSAEYRKRKRIASGVGTSMETRTQNPPIIYLPDRVPNTPPIDNEEEE